MTTISDIANKSNRKLYMNHLSSLAKLREARLRIQQLEKGFCDIIELDDAMIMSVIARACLTGKTYSVLEKKKNDIQLNALGETTDD